MGKRNDPESHVYEIRKDGKVYMSWTDPSIGYSKETLRSMKQAGYRYYIDGQLQR